LVIDRKEILGWYHDRRGAALQRAVDMRVRFSLDIVRASTQRQPPAGALLGGDINSDVPRTMRDSGRCDRPVGGWSTRRVVGSGFLLLLRRLAESRSPSTAPAGRAWMGTGRGGLCWTALPAIPLEFCSAEWR
jgi:hypothetical protein